MSGRPSPAARAAVRPLRVARKRVAAEKALWELREELGTSGPSEIEDDVLEAIEACLATLDAWAATPPQPGVRLRRWGDSRSPRDQVTTSDDPLLVDAAEAARLLGVGRHAIYRGLPGLHPVRLGRRVRYRMSDVRAIVEGRTSGDGPAPREGDDPPPPNTDERTRLAQALGNACVRLLVDEGFMTVNEVNDRLVPMLNERWTALVENWGDEHDEEDEG